MGNGRSGRSDGGLGVGHVQLLCLEWMVWKDLMDSTRKSTQYSVVAYMGKESDKERIYVYVQLIHFA